MKAQVPQSPPLPPHMQRSTEITAHVLRHHPCGRGGSPMFKATYWGPSSAPATGPLLLRCWQWARASVHGCGNTKPLLPSPTACPCWARSNTYENTLIISFKLLRNKVILFFFYNPSKKKKFTLAQGANTRPSPAEHWPLSRNACCAPAASETPRPLLRHTR